MATRFGVVEKCIRIPTKPVTSPATEFFQLTENVNFNETEVFHSTSYGKLRWVAKYIDIVIYIIIINFLYFIILLEVTFMCSSVSFRVRSIHNLCQQRYGLYLKGYLAANLP